jgi:hypothetical protein
MSVTDELLHNAEQYAETFDHADLRFHRPSVSRCSRAWTRG